VERAAVDDVVIVGGCTRIPKVQHMLSEFFQGKDLSRILNADEGVAYGAALRAAMVAGGRGCRS
jgi:molecular chaperone DnaK (HSP70)